MKYAAIVEFSDLSEFDETRPRHREYLSGLLAQNKLFLAGGFTDRTGGIIIFEADSADEVGAMLQADPFTAAGVFGPRQIRPYNAFFQSPALLPPASITPKWAAIIEYPKEPEKIAAIRPTHRQYLASLQAEGKLPVSGPFTDDSGALIVYNAESLDAAEALLKADPFFKAGIFMKYAIRPWGLIIGNESMYPKS